jgi:predicted nucleic acid-binding protein
VESELAALTHPVGRSRVEQALRDGWLKVEPLPATATALVLPDVLDPGEIQAIQLCRHLSAGKLLLDEALARAVARAFGLKITGLLGELVFAKHVGKLPSVKEEIARLRSEARFFVSAEIEAIILAGAGE